MLQHFSKLASCETTTAHAMRLSHGRQYRICCVGVNTSSATSDRRGRVHCSRQKGSRSIIGHLLGDQASTPDSTCLGTSSRTSKDQSASRAPKFAVPRRCVHSADFGQSYLHINASPAVAGRSLLVYDLRLYTYLGLHRTDLACRQTLRARIAAGEISRFAPWESNTAVAKPTIAVIDFHTCSHF